MIGLTAEQKIRKILTGDPYGEPHFQHEGPSVVRRIEGGTTPTARIRLQQNGSEMVAICPTCGRQLGSFNSNYGPDTYKQIATIRAAAYQHEVTQCDNFERP